MRSFSPSLRPAALLATLLVIACGSDALSDDVKGASPLTVRKRTPEYRAEVVREYPHDTLAFTQGLQWIDGQLFESTGEIGTSNIRRVELSSGKVLQQRDLPAPHFGEGMTVLGDKLYQLTWKSGIAFVYDRKTFAPRGEFRYEGEGWGLTTDGSQLIMSNGTPVIKFIDPSNFNTLRSVAVAENGTPVSALNELEYVKGEIWANVWMQDRIARIDPQTGAVIGWINLTGLLPAPLRAAAARIDVLNGIAYDAAGDRILVTGKLWPRLYEITLRAVN